MTGVKAKPPRKKMSRQVLWENIAGYAFLIPWFIGIFVFTAFPILWSARMSMTDMTMLRPHAASFVGLANFRDLLIGRSSQLFYTSLRVTLTFALISVPLTQVVGLAAAVAMNRKMKGIGIFRTILYLPVIVGGTVGAFVMWRMLLSDSGAINSFLGFFGFGPIPFFNSVRWAMPTFIGMGLWGIGGRMLILLAGMQQVPEELYESATMDGASGARKFFSITLPMISPVILFTTITGIIGALQVFEAAFVITRGGPVRATYFLVLYLWEEAFRFGRFGFSSAIAWLLFFVIMFFVFLSLKVGKNHVFYQASQERGKE